MFPGLVRISEYMLLVFYLLFEIFILFMFLLVIEEAYH
jgi:hypothetical protein